MLVEQLNYNHFFRWFVGLSLEDKIWVHWTFFKNRDRLIEHEVATATFQAIKALAERVGCNLLRMRNLIWGCVTGKTPQMPLLRERKTGEKGIKKPPRA
jgi:hypothetical protein